MINPSFIFSLVFTVFTKTCRYIVLTSPKTKKLQPITLSLLLGEQVRLQDCYFLHSLRQTRFGSSAVLFIKFAIADFQQQNLVVIVLVAVVKFIRLFTRTRSLQITVLLESQHAPDQFLKKGNGV